MVDNIAAEMADLPGKSSWSGTHWGNSHHGDGGEGPEPVKALVYLSAFLPRDGEALLDIEGRNPKLVVPVNMTFDAERVSGTIMADKVHDIFYHDCSDADVADAKARLRPQALAALMTKVHITPGAFRAYSAGLYRVHRRSCAFDRHAARYDRQVAARGCPQPAGEPFSVPLDAGQTCGRLGGFVRMLFGDETARRKGKQR